MAEIRYMSAKEFRTEGYLQELNRLFLHPLGLALATVEEPDGRERLGGIWDFRGDPEGIVFDAKDLEPAARHVRELWDAREATRTARLGFMVQPSRLEDEPARQTG